MTMNIANQVSFLRTTRNFPMEAQPLSVEVNRSYVDIANAVNFRTIGLFSTVRAAITGESWFFNENERQQTFRRVYLFTSAGNIAHEINLTNIDRFTRCWGEASNGTNFYGVIWGTTVAIAGQYTFYIDPTNIVLMAGAGAPAITSGLIVLEWLSHV